MNELEPVIQYCVTDILYEKKRQKIKLYGCVTKMFTSSFYGEYSIYDKENRLLGISKNGIISWLREDLQTEEAKVWYDCIAGISEMYKTLQENVDDAGMGFTHIQDIYIEFDDAPSFDDEPNRRFDHIHIIYICNNIWNRNKKSVIY